MDSPMLEYVRERLDLAKGTWPQIAEQTGVPYGTLKRIYYDEDKSPRLASIQPLYDYFKAKDAA